MVAPCRQPEATKPRELGCRLAASHTHDNRVVQIVVGQEARPAHGAAEPETLLSGVQPLHHGTGILRGALPHLIPELVLPSRY